MGKRKTTVEENKPKNKKSLMEITGINNDWTELIKVEEESQTETMEIYENDFFIDETNQYLLLHKTSNLELGEIFNENFEGDQMDGFREKIKELVEKIFNEIKGEITKSGDDTNKKSGFV